MDFFFGIVCVGMQQQALSIIYTNTHRGEKMLFGTIEGKIPS